MAFDVASRKTKQTKSILEQNPASKEKTFSYSPLKMFTLCLFINTLLLKTYYESDNLCTVIMFFELELMTD